MAVFEEVFRDYGLPDRIRTDNGVPFATAGLAGLSRLSVWWMKLGIILERIEPGKPQQNGRHERMHRTLKAETTRPAGANILQQQERFERFITEYNEERPHEALEMNRPAERYEPSKKAYSGKLIEPNYPMHDDVRQVTASGHLCLGSRDQKLYLSSALAGQPIGLREEDSGCWTVTFMDTDLGQFNPGLRKFSAREVFKQRGSATLSAT